MDSKSVTHELTVSCSVETPEFNQPPGPPPSLLIALQAWREADKKILAEEDLKSCVATNRAMAGEGRVGKGKVPRIVLKGSTNSLNERLPGTTLNESLSHQSLLPVDSLSTSIVPVTDIEEKEVGGFVVEA